MHLLNPNPEPETRNPKTKKPALKGTMLLQVRVSSVVFPSLGIWVQDLSGRLQSVR